MSAVLSEFINYLRRELQLAVMRSASPRIIFADFLLLTEIEMSPDCCDKDRHFISVQKKSDVKASSLTDLSALIHILRCLPSRMPSRSNMHKWDGMRICPQEIKANERRDYAFANLDMGSRKLHFSRSFDRQRGGQYSTVMLPPSAMTINWLMKRNI